MRAPTILVVRSDPPEIGRCRAEACQRSIEWVRTQKNNRRMPVESPLKVVSVIADGPRMLTEIDPAQSHFANCVASATFRRRGRT